MALSESEEAQLKDILAHVRVSYRGQHTELQLKNVNMWTNIPGMAAVAVIDSSHTAGVQRPIGIRGASKCVICDEYDNAGLVCENCRAAVLLLRSKGGTEQTVRAMNLLKKIEEEGLIDALSLMTKDNIKAWMDHEIEGMK